MMMKSHILYRELFFGNYCQFLSPKSYVHFLESIYNIYHFDMYRVNSWDDLYSTGFFDYIDNGILVIEWSENIEGALPENAIRITIEKGKSDDERIFEIEGVEI